MGQPDIFLQVIALIENNTDIPVTKKQLDIWRKDPENEKIYRLYEFTYKLRNGKED